MLKGAPFRVGRRSDSSVMMTRRKRIKTRTATKASHKCDPTNPAPPVTRTRLAPVLGFVLMMVFPFSSIFCIVRCSLYRAVFFVWCRNFFGSFWCWRKKKLGGKRRALVERMKKSQKRQEKTKWPISLFPFAVGRITCKFNNLSVCTRFCAFLF